MPNRYEMVENKLAQSQHPLEKSKVVLLGLQRYGIGDDAMQVEALFLTAIEEEIRRISLLRRAWEIHCSRFLLRQDQERDTENQREARRLLEGIGRKRLPARTI